VDLAPLIERMGRALAARAALLADPTTNAHRIFNGSADGIAGLVVEKLGDVLIAQLHEQRLRLDVGTARDLCRWAATELGARAVYRKVFPRDRAAARARLEHLHADPTPWIGVPVEPEFAVLENGLRLLVRPYDGYSTGIFLEQRTNRRRLRDLAPGKRLLNAFAYTCGFTASAAAGGAAAAVSVDVSKKYLEWGRRNLVENGLSLTHHLFICSDVFNYYRRAQRQTRRFDLIVLDPPTFARLRRPARTFSLSTDLDRLVDGALDLLDPHGYVLLCSNHRETPAARLRTAITAAAARRGRSVKLIAGTELPEDFQRDPDYARSILVRVD
jgi:23S rRNA (cytosine1962-C5)-methyltransferase